MPKERGMSNNMTSMLSKTTWYNDNPWYPIVGGQLFSQEKKQWIWVEPGPKHAGKGVQIQFEIKRI